VKEFYRFKIWLNDRGEIVMALCSWEVWRVINFKEGILYTFKGTRATVAVFIEDTEITREMALKAVKAWMDGNYTILEIDLNKFMGIETEGTAH
jgi:hypothetical protein